MATIIGICFTAQNTCVLTYESKTTIYDVILSSTGEKSYKVNCGSVNSLPVHNVTTALIRFVDGVYPLVLNALQAVTREGKTNTFWAVKDYAKANPV